MSAVRAAGGTAQGVARDARVPRGPSAATLPLGQDPQRAQTPLRPGQDPQRAQSPDDKVDAR